MKKEYLLVRYTHQCGEFEFTAHSVLILDEGSDHNEKVHEYFMGFYPMDAECNDEYGTYTYGIGEVAVKKIMSQEITEEQYKTLNQLGL